MDLEKKTLIVVGTIAIVLASVIYLLVVSNQKKVEKIGFDYNGFLFQKIPKGYKVQIYVNQQSTPKYFSVRSDPRELESIPFDNKALELKDKKQIYVIIDPYENLTGLATMAVLEMENVIENQYLFNIPVNSAFIREMPGKNIGIKTCEDANATLGIVWMRHGETTRISSEDNCVIMEAPIDDGLVMAADRLTLTMLGVMKK